MRIVSLLPSLTEIVHALGRGPELVGVTHECDFPLGVESLPHLTRSRISAGASSAAIDAMVSAQGGSLYELDAALLESLRPDLILTQEQCDVCAVNEATVRRVAAGLSGSPHVESVNPTDLAGVFAVFRRIAELLDASEHAEALIATFEATAAEIASRLERRPPRPTALLEWLDPPFSSGHWNPEIIALAGGREVLARAGERSRRLSWSEVDAAGAEVMILAPCGFTLDQAEPEVRAHMASPEGRSPRAGTIALVDGSAFFARPGPRLEASLRIAAAIITPDLCGDLAPVEGWKALGTVQEEGKIHA